MVDKKYFAVASQQVTLGPCSIKKIEGGHTTTSARFLQLHDSNTVPAEGSVPKKSWLVALGSAAAPTAFGKDFLDGMLECVNGVYLCLSSTDGTKTIDAAATMDLFVELGREDPYTGGTVSGDLTTPRTALALNSERRLRRLEFASSDADTGTLYIQVHLTAVPAAGAKPVASFALPQNTATPIVKQFGAGFPTSPSLGGSIKVSTTSETYTNPVIQVFIKAILTPS